MKQIIFLPNCSLSIDNFIVISDMIELLNYLKFHKVKFLSIPANEDSLDILDCIIQNNLNIDTIHIQQGKNMVLRIKLFFSFAKVYSEKEIKNNIILKHSYIDTILSKKN